MGRVPEFDKIVEAVTWKTEQQKLDKVSQQLQEKFFANFNISQHIDPSNLEVLAQIEESLEGFQSQANDDPVASLTAVEGIGESLLDSVHCPPDQSVTLTLSTSHMDLNLIKKSFAEKRPEDDKTIMSTSDNIMILPDQEELLTEEGSIQITIASHYNLQASLGSASDVLTVSANNKATKLSKPLVFIIPNNGTSSLACAFFDLHQLEWSREGCSKVCHNATHTKCSCSHLTNFALIFNVHQDSVAEKDAHLDTITYVGFTISIVCMLMTIGIFLGQRVKSDRDVIHVNLCISLLTAEVIFLFGITATEDPLTCSIIAASLHYFFLAAFAWMLLEGFQIYLMLVKVFDVSSGSRSTKNFCIGYLLPLIIVVVSMAVDLAVVPASFESWDMCTSGHLASSYGTPDFCWLRVDNHFILTFIVPAAIVICANLGFLLYAIYTMIFHKFNASTRDVKLLVSYVKGVTLLIFLLGSTWIFGLLYLAINNVYLAYTFTILNSLQGVGIFVFQCLLNNNMRNCLRSMWRGVVGGEITPITNTTTDK